MADMNAFGRAVRTGTAPFLEDKRAANRQKSALDQQLAFLRKQGQLQAEMKKEQDLYEMDRALKIFEGNPNQKEFATNAMYGTPLDYLKVQKPLSLSEQATIDYQNKNQNLDERQFSANQDYQTWARKRQTGLDATEKDDKLLEAVRYLLGTGEPKKILTTDEYGNQVESYMPQNPPGYGDLRNKLMTRYGVDAQGSPEQTRDVMGERVLTAKKQIPTDNLTWLGMSYQKGEPEAIRMIQELLAKQKMGDPVAQAWLEELRAMGFFKQPPQMAPQQNKKPDKMAIPAEPNTATTRREKGYGTGARF